MALKVSLREGSLHLGYFSSWAFSLLSSSHKRQTGLPLLHFYCQIYHTTRWFAHATLLRCKIHLEDNNRIHNLGATIAAACFPFHRRQI